MLQRLSTWVSWVILNSGVPWTVMLATVKLARKDACYRWRILRGPRCTVGCTRVCSRRVCSSPPDNTCDQTRLCTNTQHRRDQSASLRCSASCNRVCTRRARRRDRSHVCYTRQLSARLSARLGAPIDCCNDRCMYTRHHSPRWL